MCLFKETFYDNKLYIILVTFMHYVMDQPQSDRRRLGLFSAIAWTFLSKDELKDLSSLHS